MSEITISLSHILVLIFVPLNVAVLTVKLSHLTAGTAPLHV